MDIAFLQNNLTCWNQLNADERQEIISSCVSVRYGVGDKIHTAGDDCIGMLMVKTGELRTYLLSDQGKEFTLFRLEAGDVCILSASCLLRNIAFDVFVDAEKDCELFLIHSSTLEQLQSQSLVFENYVLKIIADKFSQVIWGLEKMLFMSFDRRLATFLLAEYEKSRSFDVSLTHEQIARYIGSAREVVSRTLKQFEKDQIVHLYRGGIRITDLSLLKIRSDESD